MRWWYTFNFPHLDPLPNGGREGFASSSFQGEGWGEDSVDTSPPVIVCCTCCLSIFTAFSFPLTVGFSGALACTLPLAVSWILPSPPMGSAGQPHACSTLSGTPRPFRLIVVCRGGSCETVAVASRMPFSVKALRSVMFTVEALAFSASDGRRTSTRLKVAAAPFSVALPPHTPHWRSFASCRFAP